MSNKKEIEKKFRNAVRDCIKKHGEKMKVQTIYAVREQNMVCNSFIIVFYKGSKKVDYRITIKPYIYDDLFWRIINMTSNSSQNDSLRAVGAYAAPSVLLESGNLPLEDNYEEVAEILNNLFEMRINYFLSNYDVNEYVVTDYMGADAEVLKCLAYLQFGNKEEAKKIAEIEFAKKHCGGVINEGKGFFEWLLLKLPTL